MRCDDSSSDTRRAAPAPDTEALRPEREDGRLSRALALACAIGATLLLPCGVWAGAIHTVTTVADTDTPFDGHLSLREAILLANATGGVDTIRFDIDNESFGPPPHVIAVGTGNPAGAALPVIVDTLIIDATTEPDYQGSPIVVLDGSAVTGQLGEAAGLFVQENGGGSSFFGLVIQNFAGTGIRLYTGGNLVEANYVGTDASGSVAAGNGEGILISVTDHNTIVDNLISGNHGSGIHVAGTDPMYPNSGSHNQILDNRIGTDVHGTSLLGNAGPGILVSGSRNAILDNVVSGNGGPGIWFQGAPWWVEMNTVRRNRIGTDLGGTAALPNVGHGVMISAGFSRLHTIGGLEPCRLGQPVTCHANTIAFNKGDGVSLHGPGSNLGTAIRGNAIFGNSGLGIDLGDEGVTPNDPSDGDQGPNGLLNFPVLGSALTAPLYTLVSLTLDHPPQVVVDVDFYVNDALDRSLHGEGRHYLTSRSFTVPLRPVAFLAMLPPIPPGKYLTATATDASRNTSEFSKGVVVQ